MGSVGEEEVMGVIDVIAGDRVLEVCPMVG